MHLHPIAAPTLVGAAILFWFGMVLERKLKSRAARCFLWTASIGLASPSLLFALYYTHVLDGAVWFYRFRTVQFTELAAAGIGLLMGTFYSWFQPGTLAEKLAAPVATFLLVSVPFIKPVLEPIALSQLSDQPSGEICLQSTQSTCGPSSAATILRSLGQPASERELAYECFTYRGGTEIWYVARAFRRRGFKTDFMVQSPWEDLLPAPAVAGVLLPGRTGHFIAILDESNGMVTVADPLKGKFVIRKSELRRSYTFTGFFLVIQAESATVPHVASQ